MPSQQTKQQLVEDYLYDIIEVESNVWVCSDPHCGGDGVSSEGTKEEVINQAYDYIKSKE